MDKMADIPYIHEFEACDMPDGHWIDRWGDEVWIKDGTWHCEHGPAVILSDGEKQWWLNGVWLDSFEDWLDALNVSDSQKVLLKLKHG